MSDDILRCLLTNNACGKDVWPTGNFCVCDNCKERLVRIMDRIMIECFKRLNPTDFPRSKSP